MAVIVDAERLQGVVDRVRHRGGGACRAGLPGAFGAELRFEGRRDHVADLDVGHLGRHRHEIIGHVAVQELPALVVEAVLEQRRAEPLHDAAADLLVDELRVDDGAAILHHPMAQQR